jgi:hypothetical protein
MASRIVLAALSIMFGIAVIGATATTIRQLNLASVHGQSAIRTTHPS